MAEQQTLTAPFPAPPPFYKHFTKDNAARLRQARKEAGVPQPSEPNSLTTKDVDVLSLPPELRYLIPPAPPTDDKYRSFGAQHDLNAPEPTLKDSGIEQLYPDHPSVKLNPQPHLITLARSLLTTFLSLVGILSQNPELYEERVESLQTIMYNMHDLINQYRPHQARESLILLMEERLENMREEMRRVQEAKAKTKALSETLKGNGQQQNPGREERHLDGDEGTVAATGSSNRTQRQKGAWAALDAMEDPIEAT